MLPTFRPDRYLEPGRSDWPELVDALGAAADTDTGDYKGFIAALEDRRRHFVAHGAVSADHSHADVGTAPLDQARPSGSSRPPGRARRPRTRPTALRRHLLLEMARMSVEDGLVMTLHPGVYRNHHTPTLAPVRRRRRVRHPDRDGVHPRAAAAAGALRHRRRLPPRAVHPRRDGVLPGDRARWPGFYPSVYAGAPWWFLDAPEAIRRYRGAVTETAGFGRTSGFIDDTRAFCSIPARHDMSRRLDCGYLAELVATHRLDEDEALATAHDLVAVNPKVAFKL